MMGRWDRYMGCGRLVLGSAGYMGGISLWRWGSEMASPWPPGFFGHGTRNKFTELGTDQNEGTVSLSRIYGHTLYGYIGSNSVP